MLPRQYQKRASATVIIRLFQALYYLNVAHNYRDRTTVTIYRQVRFNVTQLLPRLNFRINGIISNTINYYCNYFEIFHYHYNKLLSLQSQLFAIIVTIIIITIPIPIKPPFCLPLPKSVHQFIHPYCVHHHYHHSISITTLAITLIFANIIKLL